MYALNGNHCCLIKQYSSVMRDPNDSTAESENTVHEVFVDKLVSQTLQSLQQKQSLLFVVAGIEDCLILS